MLNPLAKELEVFYRELPRLLKDSEGKYVLIKGDSVDVFAAYEDALKAGYDRYKLDSFLVKHVESNDVVVIHPVISCPI